MKHLITILAAAAILAGPAHAQESRSHAGHDQDTHAAHATTHATEQERIGDPWPLDTCVVSGQKLGSMGDPIVMLHEGREVRFCCKGCIGMFQKDPAKYLSMADQKIAAQQKELYPVQTCIVDKAESVADGESERVQSVVGNRLVMTGSPQCDAKLRADPGKYIALLDQAVIEKQGAAYPLQTCLVSGESLGGEMGDPINLVHDGQFVKLCCKGCIKTFEKNPTEYMQRLRDARMSTQGSPSSSHPSGHH